MKTNLKHKLLEMHKLDEKIRADLVQKGVLFDGYHPEMEEVHNRNADLLMDIIKNHGWPTKELVGDEAACAAWIVVQHAISKPDFQKFCLEILKNELEKNSIEPNWVAHLQDRINVFSGIPQIYGTQFDWDSAGELSPNPIQNPEDVDTLRSSVGLPPLHEAIDKIRLSASAEGNKKPYDMKEREEKFLAWAKRVGWRK